MAEPFDIDKALTGEFKLTFHGAVKQPRIAFKSKVTLPDTGVPEALAIGFLNDKDEVDTVRLFDVNGYGLSDGMYLTLCKVTTRYVNGTLVPSPVTNPLRDGDAYFLPSVSGPDWFTQQQVWRGSEADYRFLKRGLIYGSAVAAAEVGKAMTTLVYEDPQAQLPQEHHIPVSQLTQPEPYKALAIGRKIFWVGDDGIVLSDIFRGSELYLGYANEGYAFRSEAEARLDLALNPEKYDV